MEKKIEPTNTSNIKNYLKWQSNELTIPNGETLHYYKTGRGEKTMVLIHGLSLNSKSFSTLVEYLENDFQLILPDLRGHGLSSYNKPINSIDDVVEDINHLLDSLKLETVSILGYCFGGLVSFRYAAVYPNQVEKIILINSLAINGFPMFIRDPNDRTNKKIAITREEVRSCDIMKEISSNVTNQDLVALIEHLHKVIFACDRPINIELVESFAHQQLDMNLEAFVDYRWAARLYNYTDRTFFSEGDGSARNLKCQVLVVYGGKDVIIPKITTDHYAEYLGEKVKVVEVEGAGHVLIGAYDKEIMENLRELFNF